jgi:hypothetical protein
VSKQVLYWGKGTYCGLRICLLSTEICHNNLKILSVVVVETVREAFLIHEEYSQVIGSWRCSTCKSS